MKPNFMPSVDVGHFFRLHSKPAAYAAFVAIVLACVLAAAMVASNDLPLVLGGF